MAGMHNYSDAALMVVGHGSTLNAESSLPTCQHAEAIRQRGMFAEVRECFWKQEPFIRGVLDSISAPRVFVVPLFISEGYFTGQIIPRELGLSDGSQQPFRPVQRRGSQTIFYGGPVGTHESMTAVLLARAREIVRQHPFPRAPRAAETSLFIAGHGTGNNANSRRAIERQVDRIREMKLYADVHAVFMEEEPRIGDCYALSATRNIVMVPFFISDGLHSQEDIPVMLGEPERVVRARLEAGQPPWRNPAEKQGKLVWYSPSVGSEPGIVDVILQRVREVALAGD